MGKLHYNFLLRDPLFDSPSSVLFFFINHSSRAHWSRGAGACVGCVEPGVLLARRAERRKRRFGTWRAADAGCLHRLSRSDERYCGLVSWPTSQVQGHYSIGAFCGSTNWCSGRLTTNRLPTSHLTTTAAKLSISLKLPAAPPHTKKTPMPYQRRRAVLVFDAIKIMRAVVLPAALASYPAVKFNLLPAASPDGASASLYVCFWVLKRTSWLLKIWSALQLLIISLIESNVGI